MASGVVARCDLTSLLDPVDPATFIGEYWEQRPLVLTGRGNGFYDEMFSLATVDDMLAAGAVDPFSVGLVRDGTTIPVESLANYGRNRSDVILEAIYSEYRAGATMVLTGVHEKQRTLADLCQKLSETFSASFQVNAYLTPPQSRGLVTHYDTHDVFVLQIEGSKHWRLFDSPLRLPLKGQTFKREGVEPGPLREEIDLVAGDLIYLPRGFIHDAASGSSTSLHLTVGIHPITWASVILGAVEACIEQEPRLRASLPAGFAHDGAHQQRIEVEFLELMTLIHQRADARAAVQDATQQALVGQSVSTAGRLLDLEGEAGVDADTRVKRRPDLAWELSRGDDTVDLLFNSKVVRIPAFAEQDVSFAASAADFTVRDLPSSDEAGALVLVRRLLREGFLTICR